MWRIGFLALALVATTTASAKQKLDASWGERAMSVNGNLDDWGGRLVPLRDGPVLIGVANNSEFLYIAIRSADADLARRAYYGGLIVWIRPKHGSDLGIQSPFGKRNPTAEPFILFGQGSKEGQQIAAENPFGLDLRTSLSNGEFVYEIKVPLRRSALHPFALDTAPGAELALEIATPDNVRARSDQRSSPGAGATGGSGGGMHHHGGGMGSSHGGGTAGTSGGGGDFGSSATSASPPPPVKARANVTLATMSAPR